jgi:hypothetical protein
VLGTVTCPKDRAPCSGGGAAWLAIALPMALDTGLKSGITFLKAPVDLELLYKIFWRLERGRRKRRPRHRVWPKKRVDQLFVTAAAPRACRV